MMRGISFAEDFGWAAALRSSGGGGTSTTTTNNSPPPQVLANYQNVTAQANNVASQPYPTYNGQLVAGFNPQQETAFNNVNNAAFAANPFINQGSQDSTNATSMLSPGQFGSTIQSYQDPYTQQVVNATQNEFNNQNAQQQQQVQGNAASQGALGGDREAVAQGITAGQEQLAQAPVIANLNNQGFQTATNAAESNAWLNSQGAGVQGQLGAEAQNTGLAGANAQLGVGTAEQQLAQEQLNVPYEQFQAAEAFPYQSTGFESNIDLGLGSASGGSGSTSVPGPSALSQVAGLATAGAGIAGIANNAGLFSSSGSGALANSFGSGVQDAGTYIPGTPSTMFQHGGGRVTNYEDALAGGGRISDHYAAGGTVPIPNSTVPNLNVSFIPDGPSPSSAGHSLLQPSGSTGTSNTAANPGQEAQSAIGTAASIAAIAALVNRGGRIHRAPGGPVGPSTSFGSDYLHPDHGMGIPRPPMPSNPSSDLGGLGELASIARTGRGTTESHGGRVTGLEHFDDGGAATSPAAVNNAAEAAFGGNPLLTQSYQNYAQMTTEQLQEAAARFPPTSQQGQMVQRALMQRRMSPQSDPAQQQAAQQPAQPTQQPTAQAPAQQGFGAAMPQSFADGGTPDDVSSYVPVTDDWTNNPNGGAPLPVSATAPAPGPVNATSLPPPAAASSAPSVPPPSQSSQPAGAALSGNGGLGSLPAFPQAPDDQTAQAAPAAPDPNAGFGTRYPTSDTGEPLPSGGRGGKSDTGSGLLSSPETLLAMGLGILGGSSPFAGVNIGKGALAGLDFAKSMPDYRMHQIQAEQAQENLDALRSLRNNVGLGAATPGAAASPGPGAIPGAPSGGGDPTAGAALSGASGVKAVSTTSGAPLFDIGTEYSNAQRMMMSGLPAYVDAGKAKLEFLNNLVKEGIVPGQGGGVVPLSGYAEAQARKAGLIAGATAPVDIAKEIASRSGMPLKLEPGETATTGAAALPPEYRSLINNVTGVGSAAPMGGQPAPQSGQAAPAQPAGSSYASRVASVESPTGATNGDHAGVGQFDPPTWLSNVRAAYPQAQNMTDAQLLPLRGNRALSMAMIDQNAQRNAPALAQAGLPVNQSSAYLAHWFGAQGAIKLARAPASTPVASLFPADLIQQNGLQGKTAGDVVQGVVSRFGTAPLSGGQPQGQQGTQYAQSGNTATDATPQQATSFQPGGPAIPGMISVTRPPPDLPPSQSLASPTVVQNANGSLTSSLNPYTEAIQKKYATDVGAIPDEVQKLNNTQLLLAGLHDEVTKNASQPGWYQSGAGAEWRNAIAKGANAASAALGGNPLFDPNSVANTEQFNKNSNVAAFSLARTMAGGRVALGEVLQANRSVPSMANTPFGNVMVTQLLLQDNTHQSDRLRYQAEQAGRGVDPIVSGRTFDQYNPVRNYVSAAAAGAVNEAYPQVVTALKGAPTTANIEAFNRKFGDGSAQVLLSGQ
jgi:hypothetical protein